MRFGLCAGLDRLSDAKQTGADYLELPLAAIMALNDADFSQQVAKPVKDLGLEIYSCNVFLPGTLRLTGETADHAAAVSYAKQALDRAQSLNVKAVVLGSGGARNLPNGFPLEAGLNQMRDFLQLIAPHAEACGIQIVIEPLNRGESNLIHTLSDGANLARRVDHPAVAALVDYYHMRLSDEFIEGIKKAGPLLAHVHLARPLGRTMPQCAEEEPYLDFFRALKENNYTGNLSLEGAIPEPYIESVKRALAIMRDVWAGA
jgi:Sugar phosphate isomerases/epimerases